MLIYADFHARYTHAAAYATLMLYAADEILRQLYAAAAIIAASPMLPMMIMSPLRCDEALTTLRCFIIRLFSCCHIFTLPLSDILRRRYATFMPAEPLFTPL